MAAARRLFFDPGNRGALFRTNRISYTKGFRVLRFCAAERGEVRANKKRRLAKQTGASLSISKL